MRTKMEAKWQKKWKDTELYKFNPDANAEKFYMLEMFSYPSAAKLHAGHWYNYGPSDTYARFKRMQGYNVFHPMGFDAFGLPAENYAIKTGIHPMDSTLQNIETMEKQLQAIGATFDWDYEVKTCMPDYYRWTQWCFLQLYKHGLAYRKEAPVNWCPGCNTVLANEQVLNGGCERCTSEVQHKNLTQWFFKTTAYAEELLQKLDTLDWPERTKIMQKNWIGKSVGGNITFKLKDMDEEFTVFTTRADTLFGCTYAVIAPEHPLVHKITTPDREKDVQGYIESSLKQTDIERLSTTKEKTGVFTGAYAINPINGREVPVWVADYVLYTYGTGAVMAVPAHDERDFEFATKFNLPIERVVSAKTEGEDDALPYIEYGVAVNSGEFSGLATEDAQAAVIDKLHQSSLGESQVNYRLRDWLISRQRYWGAPIPIIHCETCGAVPVPEDQLPVLLPYDVDFTPKGTSPLGGHAGFMNVKCPACGQDAKRDADTMDTFVCSSWYFLRYPDNKNEKEAWNKQLIDKLLPVDMYVGGAEHACMHLLYARFFTKAFRDMGYLSFDEPFTRLVHQGVILGTDGFKMSKSRGNVVSPDDYVSQYGSDVFRMYLMFGFAYIEGGAWNDDGIKAINRLLDRIEKLIDIACEMKDVAPPQKEDQELNFILNNSIMKVTQDVERFQFNTAIARIIELTNAMYKYIAKPFYSKGFLRSVADGLITILAPFAPHFAEECWERLGNAYSIFNQQWPSYNEDALKRDVINIGVQINGKVRGNVDIDAGLSDDGIKEIVLNDARIKEQLAGKQIVKFIVIKGRLVNIVVK